VLSISNNQSINNKKSWMFDLLGLAILLGFFYALWIGSHPLFTPDEGRYSEVAREMVVSGDYVTPRLNGVAFLDKPALYYWLQASAIKMFGLTEGALRFWPALLGILSMLVTYMTGRLLFSRRAGLMSAIILATSPLYYGGAHYANLDLEVASLVADSLLCFIAAMEGSLPQLKNRLLLAAYTFAGLAALTKGLIGIAFPAMIIGAWILLLNRWNILTKMRLFTGLLIFVLIAAPWYVLVQQANPEFLHFFFVTQQVSRFLTTQDFNSKAAVWFYLPVVLLGFFPWTVFLVQALAQKCRQVWQDRQQNAAQLYLLLWFVIVFVFFSIPRSKTVGYILPIFPVMALLVGSYLDSAWDNAKAKGMRAASMAFMFFGALLSVAFIVLPYFNQVLEAPPNFLHYVRYMGVAIAIAVAGVYSLRNKQRVAPLFSCLTATIAVLLLIFIFSATTINEKTIKPLAMQLKSQLQPDDEVVAFYKYYQDLPIYLERRVTIVADWHAEDIPRKDNWLREMWYGMVFQDTKNWLIEQDTFWQRWNSGKRLYVITDEDYYKDLKAKTTVYKIAQHNDVVLLSNKA
jgi:4-amino-4-deoxy-L-arabinose transferase-like glycosyltransferase